MPLEWLKLLEDMRMASESITRFAAGRTLAHYLDDEVLRAAIERKFILIGEAASRLTKVAPEVAARVSELKSIIGFRHKWVHGYGEIDDRTVWDIVESGIPRLLAVLTTMIDQESE